MSNVTRTGTGLHGGAPSRVTLRRHRGPVLLRVQGREHALTAWRVASTLRATTVEADGAHLATVEHLFAACAGMSLHEGLSIDVDGEELPLLDGGARAWCDALAELAIATSEPPLAVLRDEEVAFGNSRYRFARGASKEVHAKVVFGDARVDGEASWLGGVEDFRNRIATARTFAFAAELERLARAGLASHVSPEAVLVIAPDSILHSGIPFARDEPARHKLLDLVGDLFLYGGPPRGRVHAVRPGHARNHAAVALALARGILGRR